MFYLRNKLEGPKSADIVVGLRDIAMDCGVSLTIEAIEETGSFFSKRQHVYYKAESTDKDRLIHFGNVMKQTINNFNNQLRSIGISGYGI